MRAKRGCFGAVVVAWGVLAAATASAQVLGTFRWQFAPYCNTVTLTFDQKDEQFVVSGFDDMCGASRRAPASGSAHLNPDGTVAMGITVIRPDGLSVQHSAVFTPTSPSGTWADDYGNGGTFAFGAASPSPGAPRPVTLRGAYGARDNAASASAASAQILAEISFGRALRFTPQAQVVNLGAAATLQCPGTAALPEAAPGFLCLYERSQVNRQPAVVFDSNFNPGVADRFGAIVYIANIAAGIYGSSGSWAVTLP